MRVIPYTLQAMLVLVVLLATPRISRSQSPVESPWHGIQRTVHYFPDGDKFYRTNGPRRFNRALYGGHTAFRVEAGDYPDLALYLPGLGGSMKFGLLRDESSAWMEGAKVNAFYRPGSMEYEISGFESGLGSAEIQLTVLPLFDREAMMVRIKPVSLKEKTILAVAFGGATGLKFSRDGDIGADPESSFYLKPENCKDNIFRINKNSFELLFGSKKPLSEEQRYEIQYSSLKAPDSLTSKDLKTVSGIFPPNSLLKTADATGLQTPYLFWQAKAAAAPVLAAQLELRNNSVYYFLIQNKKPDSSISYKDLARLWANAEAERTKLAERIKVNTPDPWINTLGGALSVAADAIWEDPSFMHGAVAWRMRLNGWRGAYAADVLGWHDRARKHFSSYALSQLTSPITAPVVMDTALHLARGLEKLGTSVFSSGYISRNPNGDFRPHHYDMNLVFVDQLLNHFQWTGDTAFLRQSWPLLKRHQYWEKRNFDTDGDGLYDSYAAIWASDALQYSGGGVTHSSAYNYRANEMMAKLAAILKEDPTPYKAEAEKILNALNKQLWIKDRGVYAEFKDLLGNKMLHSSPGLWTIYHAIDSRVPDQFQAYQMLQYINNEIPHIPIRAKELTDTTLYTLATTNWQPYTWSLNNVALAELLHTSLAYWQAGDNEEAYRLWKGSLIESMYLGASPGNIQQLSFYDAIRGELYRDFADPIGMAARSLVEGLFGIRPDLLKDTLYLSPGFPSSWDHASLETPDIKFSWKRKDSTDNYLITSGFPKQMNLHWRIKAKTVLVKEVLVNGKVVKGYFDEHAVGGPVFCIDIPAASFYDIKIQWGGKAAEIIETKQSYLMGKVMSLTAYKAEVVDSYLPQPLFTKVSSGKIEFIGTIKELQPGTYYYFLKLKQGEASWWAPIKMEIQPAVKIETIPDGNIRITNLTPGLLEGDLTINNGPGKNLKFDYYSERKSVVLPASVLQTGTNKFVFNSLEYIVNKDIINWNNKNNDAVYDKIDLSKYFNDDVKNIFKNNYLSPRPNTTTLQLPIQGIGNWAYPLTTAIVNDSAFRKSAGPSNEYRLSAGIPFKTTGASEGSNIIFTSQWDNYPDSVRIQIGGKAKHAYLLMAGSTNPMQSRFDNGEIVVQYRDGSTDILKIRNPENWWPVEQDYYVDGYAFTTDAPKPPRIYFRNASEQIEAKDYISIKGFSSRGVEYGAATVLDLPLDPAKELKTLTLRTIANDVVIGLMSITLLR